ncbi:MAG TPA: hypothetical protein VKE94_14055, partial [Gemmataceae bacterium]|nr:hypothetical protein [Gemmataceae bacterium]
MDSFLLFQKTAIFAPIAAGVVSRAASVDGTTQPAQVAGMTVETANVPSPGAPGPLPAVCLELRTGSATHATHDVHDVSFLVGTVPGCDLRLPGGNLPSVLCLISRHASGVTLRKLATVLPITINGRAVTSTPLTDGDSIKIGAAELRVRITANSVGWAESSRPTSSAGPHRQQRVGSVDLEDSTHPTQVEPAHVLKAREQQLEEEARALDTERAEWEHRRAAMERDFQKQAADSEQL